MYVDNITITSDSEYGYYYFINYTDFKDGGKHKVVTNLISYDINKVLLELIFILEKEGLK